MKPHSVAVKWPDIMIIRANVWQNFAKNVSISNSIHQIHKPLESAIDIFQILAVGMLSNEMADYSESNFWLL